MTNPTNFITVDSLKKLRIDIHTRVDRIRKTINHEHLINELFVSCLKPLLEKYYPIVSPLAKHYGCSVYRARQCSAEEPFTNTNDLYNPPSPSGRAYSDDNIPILYASSSMQTCLAECNPKIGQVFAVANFDYSAVSSENFWFVGQLQSFQRSSEPSHYLQDHNQVEIPFYYPNAGLHSWTFTDALINEIFSELSSEEDNYLLNRYIIKDVLNEVAPDKNLFGLLFNSVKSKPGTNFAFFGDSIEKLEIKIVNLVKILDIDEYGFIAYQLLKNSNPKGSTSLAWPEHELTNV